MSRKSQSAPPVKKTLPQQNGQKEYLIKASVEQKMSNPTNLSDPQKIVEQPQNQVEQKGQESFIRHFKWTPDFLNSAKFIAQTFAKIGVQSIKKIQYVSDLEKWFDVQAQDCQAEWNCLVDAILRYIYSVKYQLNTPRIKLMAEACMWFFTTQDQVSYQTFMKYLTTQKILVSKIMPSKQIFAFMLQVMGEIQTKTFADFKQELQNKLKRPSPSSDQPTQPDTRKMMKADPSYIAPPQYQSQSMASYLNRFICIDCLQQIGKELHVGNQKNKILSSEQFSMPQQYAKSAFQRVIIYKSTKKEQKQKKEWPRTTLAPMCDNCSQVLAGLATHLYNQYVKENKWWGGIFTPSSKVGFRIQGKGQSSSVQNKVVTINFHFGWGFDIKGVGFGGPHFQLGVGLFYNKEVDGCCILPTFSPLFVTKYQDYTGKKFQSQWCRDEITHLGEKSVQNLQGFLYDLTKGVEKLSGKGAIPWMRNTQRNEGPFMAYDSKIFMCQTNFTKTSKVRKTVDFDNLFK